MILHVKKRGGINVFVFVFANKSAAARCHQRVCLSPLGARPTRPVDPVMMSLTRRRIPDGWWSKLRVAKDPVTDMASRSPRVARETSMMANALILLIAVMCCIKGAQSAAVPSVPAGQEIPEDWSYREYRWARTSPEDVRSKLNRLTPFTNSVKLPSKINAEQKGDKIYPAEPPSPFSSRSIMMSLRNGISDLKHGLGNGAINFKTTVSENRNQVLGGVATCVLGFAIKSFVSSMRSGKAEDQQQQQHTSSTSAAAAAAAMPSASAAPGASSPADVAAAASTVEDEAHASPDDGTTDAAAEVTEKSDGGATAFVRAPTLGFGNKMDLTKRVAACFGAPASLVRAATGVVMQQRAGDGGEKKDKDISEPAGFEKFFAGFFESIGASPDQIGMKRFDRERFPEQYPATLDEWAPLLESDMGEDNWEMQAIRPMLARTSLESRPIQLVYDGNYNGWDANAFHAAVDKKGPGVVIARSEGGAIFGGYNPKGWVGLGEYRGSIAAFLFTWRDGDLSKKPIKCRKTGGSSLACVDMPETGPVFGMDGLAINLAGGSRGARCKLGPYYERLPDGSNSLFASDEKLRCGVTDLRVYVGVYDADEEIPYDDALPFQLE